MGKRLLTGLLAAAWLGLLALGAARPAEGGRKPVETSGGAEQTEAPADGEARRTLSAIVIHEAASWDGACQVTAEIAGAERTMTLEDYLVGVLMGEMPASFPLEALKAQAVAARTYTMHRLEAGGVLSDNPAVCQAYCDPATAPARYGDEAAEYLDKLTRAVRETDGQVLKYEDALITATYFSCSGGRTESAQAVWGGAVPYLVSVDSPGEEDAPAYSSVVTVDMAEFLDKLGVETAAPGAVTYTEGGGVDTLSIGGKTFSGTQLRSLFGLKSTCFTLEIGEDLATFSVRGSGHRVGLSQYGARAMALEGCGYEEILRWYYRGAALSAMV